MHMVRFFLSLALVSAALAHSAFAQQRPAAKNTARASEGEALEFGKTGSWGIFTSGKGNAKNCFVRTQPAERLPKGLTRDPAHMFVTMRQGEATKMEFFNITGYSVKPGTDAQISIGNQVFAGVSQNQMVWLKNPAEESRFIGELRKGGSLSIKGTSLRGNDTTDRYVLTGFAQALERAQKECS